VFAPLPLMVCEFIRGRFDAVCQPLCIIHLRIESEQFLDFSAAIDEVQPQNFGLLN
jgi:hypothetical protein